MGNGPLSCEECVAQFLIDFDAAVTVSRAAVEAAIEALELCVFGGPAPAQDVLTPCEACVSAALEAFAAATEREDFIAARNTLELCVFPGGSPST